MICANRKLRSPHCAPGSSQIGHEIKNWAGTSYMPAPSGANQNSIKPCTYLSFYHTFSPICWAFCCWVETGNLRDNRLESQCYKEKQDHVNVFVEQRLIHQNGLGVVLPSTAHSRSTHNTRFAKFANDGRSQHLICITKLTWVRVPTLGHSWRRFSIGGVSVC